MAYNVLKATFTPLHTNIRCQMALWTGFSVHKIHKEITPTNKRHYFNSSLTVIKCATLSTSPSTDLSCIMAWLKTIIFYTRGGIQYHSDRYTKVSFPLIRVSLNILSKCVSYLHIHSYPCAIIDKGLKLKPICVLSFSPWYNKIVPRRLRRAI